MEDWREKSKKWEKMGNGPPIKKSHFFRKEKNGHTQEKKNNGQKMGTLKKMS